MVGEWKKCGQTTREVKIGSKAHVLYMLVRRMEPVERSGTVAGEACRCITGTAVVNLWDRAQEEPTRDTGSLCIQGLSAAVAAAESCC